MARAAIGGPSAIRKGVSGPRLVGTLVTRTAVSGDAFNRVFESADDCILAAFKKGVERLSLAAVEAARREDRWLARIRAGLVALLGFLDDEPQWARLLIIEQSLDGVALLECAQRLEDVLSEVLQEAREELIIGAELAPPAALIAELSAIAVHSVIRRKMLTGSADKLVDLAPSLMTHIAAPYLERGAARADLIGGAAGASAAPVEAKVIPIRPHPRVMAALRSIASAPGSSSREVAIAVGLGAKDRRQTSNLLRRLEQRGLIETANPGRARHEHSSWLLTPYGHRVFGIIADSFAAMRPAGARPATAASRRPSRSGHPPIGGSDRPRRSSLSTRRTSTEDSRPLVEARCQALREWRADVGRSANQRG